jgi:hypothetical protein
MKRGDLDNAAPLTRAEVEFLERCARQGLDLEWPLVERLVAHAMRTVPKADSLTDLREALDRLNVRQDQREARRKARK